MIDPKGSQISFNIQCEIPVSKDGKVTQETEIAFNQPTRKVAAKFETLVSIYNQAMMKGSVLFNQLFPEQMKQQRLLADAKEKKGVSEEISTKPIEELTQEDLEKEVEASVDMLTNLEYDFEKAYSIFESIILYPGICKIGGRDFTNVHLDQVNYRDFKRMLLVYVIFFQKPLKRSTQTDSEQQSDSVTEAKEL